MALTISLQDALFSKPAAANLPFVLIEQEGSHSQKEGTWLLEQSKNDFSSSCHTIGLRDPKVSTTYYSWAQLQLAEASFFEQATHLPKDALDNSVFLQSVWCFNKSSEQEAMAALLYAVLRRARILQRCNIVALLPSVTHPIATLLQLESLPNVSSVLIDGVTYYPMAQRIEYAIHHAYQRCDDKTKAWVHTLLMDEVIETVNLWRQRLFHGAWAKAIVQRTLTKQQYIYSLFNLYQYVRQTTQLLGRCVSLAPTLELRNHYIEHLRGEVNHELIIEKDLEHLGVDITYLLEHHVPHKGTRTFMAIQESIIGFYQDPILMLACPLAAEGMSSAIRPKFLEHLTETIGSWGVKQPAKACRFLSSHVNTDGGDDGHWMGVVNMTRCYITTEENLQRFLNALYFSMQALQQGFDEVIADMRLWSSHPIK